MIPSFSKVPPLVAAFVMAAGLAGCSKTAGTDEPSAAPAFSDQVTESESPAGLSPPVDVSSVSETVTSTSQWPASLLSLRADPERGDRVPELVVIETLADSGLQVAYTSVGQRAHIAPLRIGAQWQHMQSCVEIVAAAPVILIREEVQPFTDLDDIIRNIEGRIVASASTLPGGDAVIQLRDAQFDDTSADAGFGLTRQIMGRFLWLSDDRPERTYPSGCARIVPPAASDA